MNREQLIETFSRHANQVIEAGGDLDASLLAKWRQSDAGLVDQMVEVFSEARNPQTIETARITQADTRFEQAYELLRTVFSPDVLASRESHKAAFDYTEYQDFSVHFGRYWRVSGNHTYDTAGTLTHFRFDPLCATECIAAYGDAGYLPLEDGRAIVAISYLVTRPAVRKGRGHGSALTRLIEETVQKIAQERGDRLEMILLESEPDARPFWYRMGYRYPQNADYWQPPIGFDTTTGEAKSNAVPEMLMVKDLLYPNATTVDRQRLLDMVRHLYTVWYDTTCENEAATKRVRDYLYKELFQRLVDSLPEDQPDVPLVEPPRV
jgi:ribosomal protein S18 acetylase RimI-like enzyme